jgi:hypothetical protein
MSRIGVAVTILIIAAAVLAGVARADVLKGDPRKTGCVLAHEAPAACALTVAVRIVKAKMRAVPNVVGAVNPSCTKLDLTGLRWRCGVSDGGGHLWAAAVTFKHLSAGWRSYFSVNGMTLPRSPASHALSAAFLKFVSETQPV